MLRLVGSIIGGVLTAFLVVFAVESALQTIIPATGSPPQNLSDQEALQSYVANQPPSVLGGVLAGWTIAAFVGAVIASRFGGRDVWPGWVVGGLFLLVTTANFVMIPHPLWMVLAGVALIVLAAWAGARVGAGAAGQR